jgi:haloacetate dehalogenase
MFEGFVHETVIANGIRINVRHAGSGPPVLLLHGYPQTHTMWHRLAPVLAERFTVICPDLRGYGDSDHPASTADHEPYAKRTMAADQLELMRTLGHERFHLVGHDRGARVARRLALDHPEEVSKLVLLDIVPTHRIYGDLDLHRATSVWRYFFLIQPADLPERLIAADPSFYLRWTIREWAVDTSAITPEALAEYERCFDAATIRSSCEDYRAGATIDLAHDRANADERIARPLLVLWSASGIGSSYDVLATWRSEAADVRGRALPCGHFLAEEQPREVAAALVAFLDDGR